MSKRKHGYVVMSMADDIDMTVDVNSIPAVTHKQTVPLAWAPGMIGAMPVFGLKRDAEAYSQGRFLIRKLDLGERKPLPSEGESYAESKVRKGGINKRPTSPPPPRPEPQGNKEKP